MQGFVHDIVVRGLTQFNAGDRRVTRGAVAPADLATPAWAGGLGITGMDFLADLVGLSAGADLLQRCLQVSLDKRAKALLPAIAPGEAGFVAELEPVPVVELLTSAGPSIEPFKIAEIAKLTREMLEASNAETIVRMALVESTAPAIDRVMFSTNAPTAAAPTGILNGIAPIAASVNTTPSEAMADDLCVLVQAVSPYAGNSNVVWVMAPAQATRLFLRAERLSYPVLQSSVVNPGVVICIVVNAVAAWLGAPEVVTSKEATTQDDTAPGDINSAAPSRSDFQTDSVSLRLRWPLSWAVRETGAISYVTATKW
ncbi:phage major capsid protein [Bradyrhizobium sp. AS23.2]|uniref:phage major capsid protein n=1 Tax=Bradyrhizobium sp. AS23.2 TaxID=1680155 RepID=UPI001431DDB8|nr:phage major capsid protein [Bradyrhizobium sp. AS23.2]